MIPSRVRNSLLPPAMQVKQYSAQNTGHNFGEVFKLTPSGQGWNYTDLHTFGNGDGLLDHEGGVVMDASGNLYGTNESGGAHNAGVVWEITP